MSADGLYLGTQHGGFYDRYRTPLTRTFSFPTASTYWSPTTRSPNWTRNLAALAAEATGSPSFGATRNEPNPHKTRTSRAAGTATGRPTPTGLGQRRRGNAPTRDTFLHVCERVMCGSLRSGHAGVVAVEEVVVPAQDGVGGDDQVELPRRSRSTRAVRNARSGGVKRAW
jgi:hypothetical protein